MKRITLSAALLAGLLGSAEAQVAVQQTATMLNAATAVCTVSFSTGTAFAVNVQTTATCTPPAGQFVYVTGISFDVCTNGTGTAANNVTFTSTNLTGSPIWSTSVPASAQNCQHWSEAFAVPLKSTAAGTAVTVVSPAAATNNSYLARVYVYYAP